MRHHFESARQALWGRKLSWRVSLKETLKLLSDQLKELEKEPRDKHNMDAYRKGEHIRGAILVLDEMFWQLSHDYKLVIEPPKEKKPFPLGGGKMVKEIYEAVDPRYKGWLNGTKNNKEPPKKGTL